MQAIFGKDALRIRNCGWVGQRRSGCQSRFFSHGNVAHRQRDLCRLVRRGREPAAFNRGNVFSHRVNSLDRRAAGHQCPVRLLDIIQGLR